MQGAWKQGVGQGKTQRTVGRGKWQGCWCSALLREAGKDTGVASLPEWCHLWLGPHHSEWVAATHPRS